MVCAPVRSIIPSLKLEDYFSVEAQKPCSISQVCSSMVVSGLIQANLFIVNPVAKTTKHVTI